ncbi:MAG: TrkH family potassium uptake protein, partial [Bacteroidota bacterium]|nr:TrkH family potassium uptake protein [Bacteroidota bacterium]
MNFKGVISILGFLVFVVGVFMLLAIPFSLYYSGDDIPAFLISSGICLITGAAVWLLFRKHSNDLKVRDGFAIVTFGWVAMSLFGSLPFMIHGSIPSFT